MNMNYLLKKLFIGACASAMLLMAAPNAAALQDPDYMSERRIFLWDVTVSMVGATTHEYHTNESGERVANELGYTRTNPSYNYDENMLIYHNSDGDIFDATRDKLIELIYDLDEETVSEILVFPYTEDISEPFWVHSATKKDKDALKEMIMSWSNLKSARTYTGHCLDKVIKGYFAKDKINRVVLLTDGAPHPTDEPLLTKILAEWDCNKDETRYADNRLVYVMLNKEAEKMKSKLDPDRGTTPIGKDDNIADFLSFKMIDPVMTVYMNELSSDDVLPLEVEGAISCKATQSRFGKVGVTCVLECEENPYVYLVDDVVELSEEGKLALRVAFKENSRRFYSNAFENGEAKINLTCKVASSCRNVTMENRTIEVKLIARPEPRVTLSFKAK